MLSHFRTYQLINPLNLAQAPTPLYRLNNLSGRWGEDIWIKRDDLTGVTLTGNKVRKLEFLLGDALDRGCDTVITCGGIQSNHCRATALAAAQLGMRCILALRGEKPDRLTGNLLLDRLSGAEIHFASTEEYYRANGALLKRLATDVERQGSKPYIIVEGGSDAVGAWGYVEALRELRVQCERSEFIPKRIIVASGSGGTHAGLLVGAKLEGWDVDVVSIAVCYDAAETVRRIWAIVSDMNERYDLNLRLKERDVHVLDEYLGKGYAIAGKDEFEVISEFARAEGVILDPVYTAKAARGLKMEAVQGRIPGASVFWHTGGSFGIFPFDGDLKAWLEGKGSRDQGNK